MQQFSLLNLTAEKQATLPFAGIDEAGIGPWAGPVVAAAVILPSTWKRLPKVLRSLNDSKQLTRLQREALYQSLTKLCEWHIGIAGVEEIDKINILQATHCAMQRAAAKLSPTAVQILIDGNRKPVFQHAAETLIGGDKHCASVAAASIIAKVTRDRIMRQLHEAYPHYGWEHNAGYGTALHRKALQLFGVTAHHRKSFRPIQALHIIALDKTKTT